MPKLSKQKARKEYTCSKCKGVIKVGEEYSKITAMYAKPKIVCSHCKIKRSELTSSDYYMWLYDLQDDTDLSTQEDVDLLKDELDSQRDELQDKYDNLPEQFQYAPVGETLQERIDNLDNAINDLENIDWPEELPEEDSEDMKEMIESEGESYEELVDKYNSDFQDCIDEASGILGNID